ncbi:prepilin peptidase [Phenylobacterium sp. J426]|uniref:A24 family peptidase n=1 Tax=Phenylobacterium sp. J426 TaxID=2898439 RepID=UPI0021508659|nr:prepilin peptidase [Phenylobacterium sp. J426]MCR5876424.1 prepilin peptidase [Phenylobacterium sp. J426]
MTHVADAALLSALALSAGALLWAAASDLSRFLIPNRVCLLLVASYGLVVTTFPMGPWLAGLAIGLLAFGLGLVLFARGLVGGGDVKLAAPIAAWAGVEHLSGFMLVTSLAGVALALVMLSPARRLMPRAAGSEAQTGFAQPMPFGAPLAAGGLWVLLQHLTATF